MQILDYPHHIHQGDRYAFIIIQYSQLQNKITYKNIYVIIVVGSLIAFYRTYKFLINQTENKKLYIIYFLRYISRIY